MKPSQDLEDCLKTISYTMQALNPEQDNPFANTGARFKNDVFEANAYDWSDCTCAACWSEDNWSAEKCTCGWRPQEYNFKWRDIEVSWYKYLGRGMEVNREVSEDESRELLIECLKSLL